MRPRPPAELRVRRERRRGVVRGGGATRRKHALGLSQPQARYGEILDGKPFQRGEQEKANAHLQQAQPLTRSDFRRNHFS